MYAPASRLALLAVLPLVACGDDSSAGADAAAAADAALADGATDGPRWIDLAPIATGPVQETAVVALGERIYVLGGIHGSRGTVADVLVYDIASDSWSEAAPLPTPLHHVNAAAHDGSIYVLGALRANFSAVGSSWVYRPDDDAWTPLAPMPAGTERGSAAVAVQDGRVVIAGGQDGAVSSDLVSAYDPLADAWEQDYPALPQPSNHLVGASVGDVVFAIGGRAGGIGDVFDRVHALAPGAEAWESRAPLPTARGGMAAGVIGDRVVVVGGEGNADAASGVFPQVEVYDPASDSWEALEDMPAPRHGMGAVGVTGTLYVPGGATDEGLGATDVHQALAF